MPIDKTYYHEVIENLGNSIKKWSTTNEQFLNLISPPYMSTEVLINVIDDYINRNKKILYITYENEKSIDIIKHIKKLTSINNYAYYRKGARIQNINLVITNFKLCLNTGNNYDLVILDENHGYPYLDKEQILNLVNSLYNKNCKFISLCFESLFDNLREFVLPVRDSGVPLFEPRIINTKIDLKKDMPLVALEYIKWSVESGRNMILYVPCEKDLFYVKEYLCEYMKKQGIKVLVNSKSKFDNKVSNNFLKIKGGIFITDEHSYAASEVKDNDIMIFFADDDVFDYKKLIYFCGRTGRRENSGAEVIFISNTVSNDMELARKITRYFNKEAWEIDLFKV